MNSKKTLVFHVFIDSCRRVKYLKNTLYINWIIDKKHVNVVLQFIDLFGINSITFPLIKIINAGYFFSTEFTMDKDIVKEEVLFIYFVRKAPKNVRKSVKKQDFETFWRLETFFVKSSNMENIATSARTENWKTFQIGRILISYTCLSFMMWGDIVKIVF